MARRLLNGEDAAFRLLMERVKTPLYSYLIRHTLSPDVAAELSQETLVRFLEKLPRFNPEKGNLSMFLFGFARLVVREWRRKQPTMDMASAPPPQTSPVQEKQSLWMTVTKALSNQSSLTRRIFFLYYQYGFNSREITEQLQIPEGTVKSHLSRVRALLRKNLSKKD